MNRFYVATLLISLAGAAHAQRPATVFRRDSLPPVFPPDTDEPGNPSPMPRVRPGNSFYRHRTDPPNVVRATLDNLPVLMPDTAIHYSALRPTRPAPRFLPALPQRPMPPFPRRLRP